MKRTLAALLVAALAPAAHAAVVDVTVDPNAAWQGFMDVSDLPANGGTYWFGSVWGLSDLTATFSGNVLTLGPNSVNDPSSFWYTPSGGPGAAGAKSMSADIFVESDALGGQTISFSGTVLSNTFASGYTTKAFVRDYLPDYSSYTGVSAALTPGAFTLSFATTAGHHVRYGFETVGPDVWSTDRAAAGSAQVTAIPEPASLAIAVLGAAPLLARRRRR
jgi:hypothetical protein